MDQKYQSLIRLFAIGKLGKKDFVSEYFEGKTPESTHFLESLESAIKEKNVELIEKNLALISIIGFDEKIFIKQLCELLQEDWHYSHEVIAMGLKEIKDPSTVDCLYSSSEKQFEYLDYDDTFQFARKCIKALSEIADENAIDKLFKLAESNNYIIAEYAKKELRYKGRL